MVRVILLLVTLVAGACDRGGTSKDANDATQGPKTSFGKAVDGARQLDRDSDARNGELERQAKELGEDEEGEK